MSGKRASDACIDFESDGLSNLLEEPLLKKRKTSSALTDVKEESPDDFDLETEDHGSQPGVCEREVDEESNKTTDAYANNKLSVQFPDGYKIPVCFVCGTKSNEPSPLLSDRGALITWRGYKKHFLGYDAPEPFCRKPNGEKCRICVNVYGLTVFSAKHGTMDDYKKNVHAKGNTTEHSEFLKQRKNR